MTLNYTYGPGSGCGTLQEAFTVKVVDISSSILELAVARDTVYLGDTTLLTAIVEPAIANATYIWFANGFEIPGQTTSSIMVQPDAVRTVDYTFQVFSPQGCSLESPETQVIVLEPEFVIPIAFTPNGDDRNDIFKILHSGMVEVMEFKIYNRWGQVVYESTTNQGWDGNHKGNPRPAPL